MELTMERVGVESNLELWTLERDHTRYVTLGRGCGRSVFSPASFEALQVTAGGKSLPQKRQWRTGWWDFSLHSSEQDLLSACPSCPLLTPQQAIAAQMPAGVLSIWNRSALPHLIPPQHLNIPHVGALCASPALWGQFPHSGASPSSGTSQPSSEHRGEKRCDGRREQHPPAASPGCPLLWRLPRGLLSLSSWLPVSCGVEVVWGLPAWAPCSSVQLQSPWGTRAQVGRGHRGKQAELSSLSQLQGLVTHTQARL